MPPLTRVLCLCVCVKWAAGEKLENIKNGAKFHDVIWLTLMGNDAKDQVLKRVMNGECSYEQRVSRG